MTKAGKTDASDIATDSRIDRWLPAAAMPYARLARLDRPIGTWLLLFPCWWGVGLAWAADATRPVWPALGLVLLFAIGSVVMRGAGCTVNDIVDRDVDGRVARTAGRPLPSGRISLRAAVTVMALLMLIGALVLFSLNRTAIWVGLGSLPLIAAYPFMKRITYWPQAVLGLTFNWGALVGWAAVAGNLAWPALILYGAGIAWTLGYDTIYAHQDKEDDALVGVKSTALLFGDATKAWLVLFYALTVPLMALSGWVAGLAWPYFLALIGVALQFAWQVSTLAIDRPRDCLDKFHSNRWTGWLVFLGLIAAGTIVRL
jgi:4-hydroxybenzoate polyprenyltransferase